MAACLAGGLLFLLISCQETPSVENHAPPEQSKTVATSVKSPQPKMTDKPVATYSPTASPSPVNTPTVGPMAIPTLAGKPYFFHKVEDGQSLSYIATSYDSSMEELMDINNLKGADAIIQIGQSLRVPLDADMPRAPVDVRWPDSEVVYSPAYVDFDVAAFIESQGGYLANYTEYTDGETLTGAQVVERVSEQFSVGPRVLLALLEYNGNWVTNPYLTDDQINYPLGPSNPYSGNLYLMLGWTAKNINAGYYGYKRDGFWIYRLRDYSLAITTKGLNAGTVGMQNILAIHSDAETWLEDISENGLLATYQELFGDPAKYKIDILVPSNLTQPPLELPWQKGKGFYFSSGPHIAFIEGSAWAALDFGPPDVLGNCFFSDEPNTAVADGIIQVARQGEVQLDLDKDGHIQTGWVVLYLHVALDFDIPVEAGQQIKSGDIIGYASCEGGIANASHLHLARRYNGEWMDAGGPVPMNLSGWVVQPARTPYEGVMKKDDEIRESCECWKPEQNLIVNE
jgi:murein DD-endopeptidase MepM/ murein hydrolase activator NlpD